MKLTTILLLGAALASPAFAASTMSTQATAQGANAGTAAQSQTQMKGSADMAQPSTGMSASSQTAMSTSGAADTSSLSSIPDTQKTYKRGNRTADFQAEAETTKQLNQQVASAGGLPKTQ